MGEETLSQSRKRKTAVQQEVRQSKRSRNVGSGSDEEDDIVNELVPGKIKRIFLKNFMCHSALEMNFNSRINFLVGSNGSGKSAILTALTVGLGAKARDTDRGASLKGFVKQGKSSAIVEITITNRGDQSYEWETYGDSITIIRSIGNASYYRIKSHTGETISTKREELDNIVKALNIQVDNPISILNQDAARSFLMSKKPEDLYKLYMRATRLDIVGQNYQEAVHASDIAHSELAEAKKYLRESEKVLTELRHKLNALSSLDMHREEYKALEEEVLWAAVIEEEKRLLKIDKKIDQQNQEIEKLENVELNKAAKEKEINCQIEELKEQIANLEAQAAASHEKSDKMKDKALNIRKQRDEMRDKVKRVHQNIKEKEDDLLTLQNEIKNLENEESRADERRQAAQQTLENAEQQLDEIDATLRTKQTDRMHLEENRNRIGQEEHNIKLEIDQIKAEKNRKKYELQGFENQPNDALGVYGNNFSRLVRRIEEEFKRGRFEKKPVGPIGSYISIRDASWIPAIESHIGTGLLRSFCVDNRRDAKILDTIVHEIFGNSGPSVITSKFFDNVHDVSEKCTRSSRYHNLFEIMEIKDVTVANTLIDQREIERVLLIPTSQEACKVMENANNVPQNCKKAITKRADLFFPDPNYKTYGGSVGRAKFLQVSTVDRIQSLRDDLNEIELRLQMQHEQYSKIAERREQTRQEHNQVQKQVRNLLLKQSEYKTKIELNREILDSYNNNIINIHKSELEKIRTWLEHNKQQEGEMMDKFRQVNKEYEAAMDDYKECRGLTTNLDTTLNPYKEKIHELKDEQKRLDVTNKGATKRLQEAKQVLQKLNGEHQQLQRVVSTKTSIASTCCPRIESTKTVTEINNRVKELKKFIEDVEKQHGDKESLLEELREHEEKYSGVHDVACNLEIMNQRHNDRIAIRKTDYNNLKADVASKVQSAFSNILSLRNYKGTVKVNHKAQILELQMIPMNDAKRLTNNAKALSGGERSYSTIGFILALWHCTGLPFYFLDEFDVFMDKINRRMIMDILIDHAEANEKSQFTFLTPLDASHVKAKNSITIHRMAPPERG